MLIAMQFDFGSILPQDQSSGPIDPIQLFRGLRVRDPGVNDLWLGQAEALQPWHQNRHLSDIAIALNTGAGKTLVGLLIAQSLVNESRGKVVYACNSIQLVEQTRDKAEGYGLEVTTYFSRDFSNQLFAQGRTPCITTYQALFNGRSRFAREELAAVVFDDAHTAENVLRDQFTLCVTHSEFPSIYRAFLAEFRDYFHRSGSASTFEEIASMVSSRLLIVPPFELRRHFSAVLGLLRGADFTTHQNTVFAWEHLKDHLDLCSFIISSGSISITPPFIPVKILPFFSGRTRRVYLSATLNAEDAFARTFGRVPDRIISPDTHAGACERFILSPGLNAQSQNDVEFTAGLIAPRKALIMTPTYSRADKWRAVAVPPPREDVTQAVARFKTSAPPAKLLLTARYDGVDLPGDTCRLMVIDGLPNATGPLERFMWEYLRMSKTLRTTIASRIVQSFGRISRGMSDYGVVVLTDKPLLDWLATPQNQMALPPFLQKQLQMGNQISAQLPPQQVAETIERCLNRDPSWISAYERFLAGAQPLSESRDTQLETELALSESKFAHLIWARNYSAAAAQLDSTLESARNLSASTAAWHQFWIGMASELAGDHESATHHYRQAHGAQMNLPAPSLVFTEQAGARITDQGRQASHHFLADNSGSVRAPHRMDANLSVIRSGGSPAQIEEAIRHLGILLGLQSSRPDNEEGTGPDNLWMLGDTALCIDAKTDKQPNSTYQKSEISQMSDHIQWVTDNTNATLIVPIFVGPRVPASATSNPPPNLLVVTLDELASLVDRVCQTCRDIAATAIPLSLAAALTEAFEHRGLDFAALTETLHAVPLVEIDE